MRILGIDPGFARAGWAILRKEKSNYRLLNCGCVETSKDKDSQTRLLMVYKQILSLIKKYKPDALAIEKLFFSSNAKTAFGVGEARGVVLLAGALNKVPVFSYSPSEIKSAVTGYGSADKGQVGRMIKAILKLKEIPKLDDTCDAVAVGLTHAFTARLS